MALTDIPCESHKYDGICCGRYTETEVKMAELDPSRTIQQHHESITLFEVAWDAIHDAITSGSKD